MSYQRWDKQKVADYILAEYKKRGSDLRCTHMPSRIRQLVIDYWGGWRKALSALNIQIEGESKLPYIKLEETGGSIRVLAPKENTKKETSIIKWFDDKEATEIAKPKKYIESKCWKCLAPIASDEYFCPWHDHWQIPKGAVFYTDIKTSTGKPIQSVVITMCPLFKQETPEDRKRIRKRNIEKAEKERLSKQGGYYKVSL